jgi:hypothetical protein
MGMKTKIEECKRDNLCVDCDNKECWFAGQAIADCPLIRCNRKGERYEDCESCELLKQIREQAVKRNEL